jgi:hypothetical protein
LAADTGDMHTSTKPIGCLRRVSEIDTDLEIVTG